MYPSYSRIPSFFRVAKRGQVTCRNLIDTIVVYEKEREREIQIHRQTLTQSRKQKGVREKPECYRSVWNSNSSHWQIIIHGFRVKGSLF